MRTAFQLCVLIVLSAANYGCGDSEPHTNLPSGNPESAMNELGQVYKYIADQNARVPRSLRDFEEYSGAMSEARPMIDDGRIIVNWGKTYSPNSNGVLAHENGIDQNGGFVLFQNIKVKKVTADEYKSL